MIDDARSAVPCGTAANDRDYAAETLTFTQSHILSIREVSRMFGISTLTLRLYELLGLIRRERAGRERVYSWFDCERIALLIKARKARVALARLVPVIRAMNDGARPRVANAGRRKCLDLIHALERDQRHRSDVLGELYRIDWELAERLGAADRRDDGAEIGRD
jgi:DNA-binding transcriptional MerR regulator